MINWRQALAAFTATNYITHVAGDIRRRENQMHVPEIAYSSTNVSHFRNAYFQNEKPVIMVREWLPAMGWSLSTAGHREPIPVRDSALLQRPFDVNM